MSDEIRCEALTASGKQCARLAKEDSSFCGIHKNSIETSVEKPVVNTMILPKLKQIVRYISRTGISIPGGAWSAEQIEDYVNTYIDLGYRPFNTHYLGENPEGYGILYILVKD